MNKHFLKYLLLFISCLFLVYSCVSEEDLLQTDKTEQTKQTFSIFSNSQNIQGKSSKSAIDYAKGFSILMQRYDSIHNTNISGLVNTNNKVEHKKKSHQNVIIENKDYYIENRLHSQTIFEENGDVWVMYPRIKNNSVDGLLIASYIDNGTNVYFSYVKKDSKLYTTNINLFQEKYNKQINVSIYNRSNGGLCGYGEEVCELDGPIITPNPGGGGFIYYPGGGDEPSPGGGCSKYQDCEYIDPDPGGGSGGNSSTSNPCEDIKKQTNDPNYKAKIDELNKNSILNKKYESGFSQNKNGSYTSITQTASSNMSDGLIIDINSDLKGLIHTHQNSYETGNFDENGNPEIRQPIKMFSPADVNALMKLAQNQSYNSYSDIYVTMVSSSGVYTLKFTGNSSDIKTGFNTPYWTNEYLNFWKNESGNNETKFLRFLSEKMNVTGVELLKVDKDGKSKKKSLGSNKKVITNDCP